MSRILLALDDGPGAEALLKRARAFAHRRNADLWVVHVLSPPPLMRSTAPETSASILESLDKADRWLGRLLRDQPDSERPLVVIGDPPQEIATTAAVIGADVLILGARPRARPLQPGNTGTRVLELAKTPVLKLAML